MAHEPRVSPVDVDGYRRGVLAHPKLLPAPQVELDLSVSRRADEDGHPADLRGCGAVDMARDDQLGRGATLEHLGQRVAVVLSEADLVELGQADSDRGVVHREERGA